MGAVTLSAPYGAGGSIVGPGVAERLGLPFLDRAIPVEVARRLAVSVDHALAHDECLPRGVGRLIALAARLPTLTGANPLLGPEAFGAEASFKEHTEAVIRQLADTTGGVILGRGGAVVLAGRADVLHVRLDGPVEARIRQAMRLEGLDEKAAREQRRQTDRAREAAFRCFYGRAPGDPSLYYLIVDSTALPLDACVELIVRAALARFAAAKG
jgi:hypothetical protein